MKAIEHCAVCGRTLGIGESYTRGGLDFCGECRNLVRAHIP